jgi:hypothetical protein
MKLVGARLIGRQAVVPSIEPQPLGKRIQALPSNELLHDLPLERDAVGNRLSCFVDCRQALP